MVINTNSCFNLMCVMYVRDAHLRVVSSRCWFFCLHLQLSPSLRWRDHSNEEQLCTKFVTYVYLCISSACLLCMTWWQVMLHACCSLQLLLLWRQNCQIRELEHQGEAWAAFLMSHNHIKFLRLLSFWLSWYKATHAIASAGSICNYVSFAGHVHRWAMLKPSWWTVWFDQHPFA